MKREIVTAFAIAKSSTPTQDRTVAIQSAVDRAGASVIAWQPAPGQLYRTTQAVVELPACQLSISRAISVPAHVRIVSDGRTLIVGKGDHDGFVWDGTAWHAAIDGVDFANVRAALRMTTGNNDAAQISVTNCTAHDDVETLLDDGGYFESRSTILSLRGCQHHGYGMAVRVSTDIASIADCWFVHRGHDGPCILSDSKLSLRDTIMVCAAAVPSRGSHWITVQASDRLRGLTVSNVRVSTDAGAPIPLVANEAAANITLLADDCGGPVISISDSVIYASPTMIVCKRLPNRISVRNVTGGGCARGIVSLADNFVAPGKSEATARPCVIELDPAPLVSPWGVPVVAEELKGYLA